MASIHCSISWCYTVLGRYVALQVASRLDVCAMAVRRAHKKALAALRKQLVEAG